MRQDEEHRLRAIFLSYRRDDAEGEAGRLFDDLTFEFGKEKVFMDVAGIEPGRDFRKVIDQNVASCGVLLAVIGKGWLDAQDDTGRRRLDDPMDFVRLETASALKRDIPVIPVLVHGGRMPRPEQLPEDLRDLAYRNAVELTHARWDSDVQLLLKALQPHVGDAPVQVVPAVTERASVLALKQPPEGGTIPVPTRPAKKSRQRLVMAVAVAMVIAAGAIGTYEYKKSEEAKVKEATETAAKQAADDAARKAAADKAAAEEAARKAASDRAAADSKVATAQAAARKAAADKAAAEEVTRKATADKAAAEEAARKAAADKAGADKAAEAARKAVADKAAVNQAAHSSSSIPNFAGTWELFERTQNGKSYDVTPVHITVTQNGPQVTLSNRTIRIRDDGTASDQRFFVIDEAHKIRRQVPTVDQAEYAEIATLRRQGSVLIYEIDLRYTARSRLAGQPNQNIWKYRLVASN